MAGKGRRAAAVTVAAGIAVLAAADIAITKLVIRHRERLAMIERGMNPDAPPQERDRQDPPLR